MNTIKDITCTDHIKGITYRLTSERVETIDINDIEQTYMGKTGCSCGCNGEYTMAADNMSLTKRRLNKILSSLESVEFGSCYASWENDDYTRATRLYFNDNVSYEYDKHGGFIRTVRTNIDNA